MKEPSFKQKVFVREYLVDLCGKDAAIRAGYAPENARITASKLLAQPHIKAAVEKAMENRTQRTQVTADTALTELCKIGNSNISDYLEFGDDGVPTINLKKATREQLAAVESVTVDKDGGIKIKLWDKNKALSEIGKHTGVGQKIDVTSNGEQVGANIVITMPDNGRD